MEGKYQNTDVYSSAFHTKDPPTLNPPKLQTLPLCFSALSSPNASYGPLRNAPARFGNVIKGVRDANGGQKGWHQADFTPGPRMARPKPGSSLRTADQKDCCTYADRSGKGTKGMAKNANPQDKYILILLQYKLMLQLVDGNELKKRVFHFTSTLTYLSCLQVHTDNYFFSSETTQQVCLFSLRSRWKTIQVTLKYFTEVIIAWLICILILFHKERIWIKDGVCYTVTYFRTIS